MNENSRQAEGVKGSISVQTKFLERLSILTPTRKLIREDQMYQVPPNEERKTKSKLLRKEYLRHVFLFNDLFVIARAAKEDKDKLSLVHMVALDQVWVKDLGGDEAGTPPPPVVSCAVTRRLTPLRLARRGRLPVRD